MKKNRISEATGSGSSGHFKVPIVLAPQEWKPDQLAPFNTPVYQYTNAELAYEEADDDFKESPEQRAKIEKKTEMLSKVDTYLKQFYTDQNDDEGGSLNDIESPDDIIKKAVGPLKEDLEVWFGTKKKPKGSKQPKGPWVNICRKVDGKHPPCGRPEASDKGYPKCRAAGVASKMSDSQKKSACQQKRRAEKSHSKTGTGNKPKMVSYKPKNESMKKTIRLTENDLLRLDEKVLNEQTSPNFDYKLLKDDSFRENTSGKALYFVKNGNTYDVWFETEEGKIISAGLKLPTRDELGIIFDKVNKSFPPNEAAKLGRKIIRTITMSQGMGDNGSSTLPLTVAFTDGDGVPKVGTLQYMKYPLDTFKGEEIPLKDKAEVTGDDYFVYIKPSQKDKYGRGLSTAVQIKDTAEEF